MDSEASSESERQYRLLFESIDEGFCVVEMLFDAAGAPVDYRFQEINPAWSGLTGLSADAVGRTALELVPTLEPFWPQTYGRVALTGEAVRFEHEAGSMDRWFDVHASRIGGPESRRVAILFSNITERKRAEAETRRRVAMDAYRLALADALRPLNDAVDIEAVAMRVLGEHLRVNRAIYFEIRGAEYLIGRGYIDGVAPLAGSYPVQRFGARILDAFMRGRAVAWGDVPGEADFSADERASFAAIQIAAFAVVPLVKAGIFVAGLSVHSATPRAWSADDMVLVEETAERTWAAVGRARAEAALREADLRKNEFLATLAHELRNPLAPLRTGLELLQRAPRDAAVVERVSAMMGRQVSQLVRLIDDLLDLSRISRGKITLRRERVALADVLQRAVETSLPVIEAKAHELRLELPEAPIALDADATRLAQVFGNLLNNAAKYSEARGRIDVTARMREGRAEVTVRDRGIGIAAHVLPTIFDPFAQGELAPDKTHGGLGIGLTLVRRLVEMHGGSVLAASAGPGEGSAFTVSLPTVAAASLATAPAAPRAGLTAAMPKRVLVADDNVDAALSLAELLRHGGHEVRVTHDGASAVAEADRFRPEVLLLDIGMPGVDGREACRRIRRQAWAHEALIVALTGWGQAADRRKSREAGFDLHLVKPVDAAELVEAIARPRH